ncbi:SDR family NAD(P)-dependent oxidoreductase [Klebsiella pneumoniae]
MNLHGKTALVTGSTSGIGLGIAKVLAQAGAQLVLNGFGDSSHARAEVAALGKIPGYHDADLRDVGQIEAMMHYAESTFGGVDIVINNAGIQHVAPVEQFPVDKWNDILAINLSSVFHTTRLALPGMRQRNWGRIINIASVHGLVASKEKFHTTRLALPGMRQRNWGRIINIASVHGLVASKEKSAYVAAKHAVVGLTKTVALETARSGITCNAICPGWVLTPLVQQQIDKRIAEGVDPEQASAQLLAEKQPSGEFVTPQQLGEMALFLCSDAAAQVRGAAWNMDGGWVAQ